MTAARALAVLALAAALRTAPAQLSSPIASNSHVSVDGNKFLQRESDRVDTKWRSEEDEVGTDTCELNIQLKWMAEATSSIYATPIITDLYADGFKDVVVNAFVHNVEAFQGDNGAQGAGFPAFHTDRVHASPLMYDADHDGVQDILVATYNGDILFYEDNGALMPLKLSVPRLPVRRNWFEDLADDNVDHSHPDVPDGDPTPQVDAQNVAAEQQGALGGQANVAADAGQVAQTDRQPSIKDDQDSAAQAGASGDTVDAQQEDAQGAGGGAVSSDASGGVAPAGASKEASQAAHDAGATRRLQQKATAEEDPNGPLSDEALDATDALEDQYEAAGVDYLANDYNEEPDEEADPRGERSARAKAGRQRLRDQAEIEDAADDKSLEDYYDRYLKYADDRGWAYDEFQDSGQHVVGDMVAIDAHIMCTPAIADIDGDGSDDLVVPVSYFFDRAYYDSGEHRRRLPADLALEKYVASGVAVFDLKTHALKWVQHLDLSTDLVQYRAYVYSAPTLVDLDHDGKLEIVVGTSVGFIYVLDHLGNAKPGWPKQMADVQAQVAVADVDGDGTAELLALDSKGSVALFDAKGTLRWDMHVRSPLAQAATLGDIDGDGRLEAVFGAASGEVYALDAVTGTIVDGYPFRTSGKIVSPVTITRLFDGPAQHLLVSCFDGFFYVIDAITLCADVTDIGDTSYTAVLVDDLDNDGQLELLLSTMSGHIYSFGTPAEYHPLKTWPQQVPGQSVFVARHDETGIYVTPASRRPQDMRGLTFPLEFEIIDKRESTLAHASLDAKEPQPGANAPYRVRALLTSIDTASMNSGEQPIIGMSETYQKPGRYTVHLPCPKSRATALVRVELQTPNGIVFVDEYAQSFHMHFDKLLKWLVAAPLLAMGLFLLVLRPDTGVLPT